MRLPRKIKKLYKKLGIPYDTTKEQFREIIRKRKEQKEINQTLDILYDQGVNLSIFQELH